VLSFRFWIFFCNLKFEPKGVDMIKKLFLVLVVFSSAINLFSQEENKNDIRWFGTIYERPTLDGRDFSNETHPYFYSMQRVSFGFEKQLMRDITIVAEAMDSRIWGQTQSGRKSIANLDLHQGYLFFNKMFDLPMDLKIGRFEAEYNKKIIGLSNWQDVPKSFDGFNLGYLFSDDLRMDVFTFQISNSFNYISSVNPSNYPYPATDDPGYYVPGITFKYNLSKKSYIQPIVIYEMKGKTSATAEKLDKITAAVDLIYNEDNIDLWAHLGTQSGQRTKGTATQDIASYGAHLYFGYSIGFIKPSVKIDINSGTKPEDQATKDNLYENNFSSGHIFWGNADYFTNLRNMTLGLGLNQYAIQILLNGKGPLSLLVEASNFTTNVKSSNDKSSLGTELDVILKYNHNKKMFFDLGLCALSPGDITKDVFKTSNGIAREDLGFFSYLRFYYSF
jgi:hypothetical protein